MGNSTVQATDWWFPFFEFPGSLVILVDQVQQWRTVMSVTGITGDIDRVIDLDVTDRLRDRSQPAEVWVTW